MGTSSVARRVGLAAAVVVAVTSSSVAMAAPVTSDPTPYRVAAGQDLHAATVHAPARTVHAARLAAVRAPAAPASHPHGATTTHRAASRPASPSRPAVAPTTKPTVAAPTTTAAPVRPAPAPAPTPPPAPTVGMADPSVSFQPSAAFNADCNGVQAASLCNSAALASINAARAAEGLGPLVLPANFASLGAVSQLVVVTNAERTSRGLPAMVANASLNAMAAAGAQAGSDPYGPRGYAWGSNITWGYATPLAADFAWMYDDGPGGTNVGCQSPGASGCWDHRHNMLAPWSGGIGAGAYDAAGSLRLTILLVQGF